MKFLLVLLLSAGQDQVTVERDTRVPLRDGVTLATDVYLPAARTEKLPTILVRTPYNKSGEGGTGHYFARHGYAYVAQDTRGRYGSEGVWRFLNDDGRDGFDAAEWILKQPWSNGKIGTIGTSYVGGTQHAMALERAPGLETMIPVDAVSNMGVQGMRNAGAFELRFWNWIFSIGGPHGSHGAHDPATAAMLLEMKQNRRTYLAGLPLRRGTTPLQHIPEYEDWLVEAMKHGANDAHWNPCNILDRTDEYKDVPVYLVGGWYDSWAGNTTANFAALSRKLKSPVYLIMGPWIHGGQGRSAHGQVSFGKEAAIPDPLAWRLEWYDRWLKGKENKVGREAPFATKVRLFVMGTGDCRKDARGIENHGGLWRDEQEWPLARTKHANYYLHGDGGLSTDKPAAERASTAFDFDPKLPVPTIGGNISSGDGIMLQGAWDQRGGKHVWNSQEPVPLSARKDLRVFQTAPLESDIEVTGEIEVKLWASSSAPDTDFTAKLIDVHPDGFDMNIADGIVRARFRESLREEKLMEPGTVYPFTIRLYPTSNVFKKGHRIRVDLSSSNFPRFDVNPNTGEPLNDNRRWAVATNTIRHDRDHASHIVLPIIPAAK